MKKTLIAMAALAAAGVASAQSNVTLYGVVDVGVSHYSADNSATILSKGGINTSRLGFKGTEDLGGGLKANFDLEGSVDPTTGGSAFAFDRMAWASLSGGFGELRLGRDYTPTFYADANYDPFGVNGVGTNAIFGTSVGAVTRNGVSSATVVANGKTTPATIDPVTVGSNTNHLRASNAISYFLPGNLGGFNGQLMYAFSNKASGATTSNDGRYVGGRLGYDAGPISAMVAYGRTTESAVGDVKTTSVAGSYDLGVAKLMAEYSEDKLGALGQNGKKKGYLLGTVVPVGAGEIHASYVDQKVTSDVTADSKIKQYSLGYVYNLSKRTALYGTYAHISNSGAAAYGFGASNGVVTSAGHAASGYDLGIRHSF